MSVDGCSVAQVTRAGGSQPCSYNPKQHHWPVAGTVHTEATTPCRVPNTSSCPGHDPCTSPPGPQQSFHLPPHSHAMADFRLWAPVTITTVPCRFWRFSSFSSTAKDCSNAIAQITAKHFHDPGFTHHLLLWTFDLSSHPVLPSVTTFWLEGTFKGSLVQFPCTTRLCFSEPHPT